MRRRQFFGALAAATAGFALDPERLLWVPGRKSFFDTHVYRPWVIDPSYSIRFIVDGRVWIEGHSDSKIITVETAWHPRDLESPFTVIESP